jgi:hypothetical protein
MIFDTRCASPSFLPKFDAVIKGRVFLSISETISNVTINRRVLGRGDEVKK